MVVDWQHAPKSDQETATKLLSYPAASVMDYDYLVRVVAAAIAAEREACAQIAVGATEVAKTLRNQPGADKATEMQLITMEAAMTKTAAEIATLIRARSKPPQKDTHPSE